MSLGTDPVALLSNMRDEAERAEVHPIWNNRLFSLV